MNHYYNEHDPYAAQWLRNLIKAGLIPSGEVDERDIQNVRPDDLAEFKQCHFFAGIAGWSLALKLAGWGADEPVWTGSCPCQPFSSAGRQEGMESERYLWSHWFHLIRKCRPATIFGEQVASAIAHGWLDEVLFDLEAEDYACAAAVLPAYSVEKNHERNRVFFVAYSSLQSRIYKPDARQAAKRLHHDEINWLPGAWDETEPKVYSIHDGLPSCLGVYHGLGNAIVPQVAAEVISAFAEVKP